MPGYSILSRTACWENFGNGLENLKKRHHNHTPGRSSDIAWADGIMTVSGERFTRWSRVAVDGRMLDTEFVDNGTLTVGLQEPPEDGAVITVRQVTSTQVTLSESAGLIWGPRM